MYDAWWWVHQVHVYTYIYDDNEGWMAYRLTPNRQYPHRRDGFTKCFYQVPEQVRQASARCYVIAGARTGMIVDVAS